MVLAAVAADVAARMAVHADRMVLADEVVEELDSLSSIYPPEAKESQIEFMRVVSTA